MTILTPGVTLGAFEILAALGEGGMGAVYRARDTRLQREVAVKVLLPAIADDPDRLARFGREAQVLASLNHPNIGAIYGLEQTGGVTALVLELVEGPTLADRLARGPIPLEEALTIAGQIADALSAAHDQGIVHRDLKPANIKMRPDGTVKVLDFGLASTVEAGFSRPDLTASPTMWSPATMTSAGLILGTPAYMSPEQASGKPVDKRTDVWAFGVVLAEMVTGRRMFDGETISHVLAAVLTTQPDWSGVPPHVRGVVSACLEKDPKRRLRDVGDAMRLLQAPREAPGPSRRWPLMLAWSVAGALTVGLAVAIWLGVGAAPVDPPAVRLAIPRPSIDPYNNAASSFALSPDGRFLAYYNAGADGRATLTVQTLATGERRNVSGSAVLSPQPPFWSPDSRRVVYMTVKATVVFDVITAATRELCTCRFQGGSWSQDGTILLGSPGNERGPIRRITLGDSAGPVAVTAPDAASGEQDGWPAFLPDGRRFLFTRTRQGGQAATYVSDLAGGATKMIADRARGQLITRPDGGPYLLGIDAAGLVAQPFDIDTMTSTGDPVVIVTGVAAVSLSANGLLATSAFAERPTTQPVWFDRRGASQGTIGPAGTITALALGPDGRSVAVTVAGADRGLWVRDTGGTNRRISDNGDAPVWSPDGTRIVGSSTRAGVVNMFERAADGSGRQRLLFPAERNVYANDWSRDGRWLVFTMLEGGFDLDLYVIRADGDGGTPVPYLTGPERDAQAVFSPDGRFVAYTSMRNGDPEVYVRPFPNAADGRWLVSPGGGAEPHWSADGKELFYVAGQTLMAVPVSLQPSFTSGTPRKLFDAPVQRWYVNDSDRMQVSPDGQRFLLLAPAGNSAAPPIDIVVNWPSLLQQKVD